MTSCWIGHMAIVSLLSQYSASPAQLYLLLAETVQGSFLCTDLCYRISSFYPINSTIAPKQKHEKHDMCAITDIQFIVFLIALLCEKFAQASPPLFEKKLVLLIILPET